MKIVRFLLVLPLLLSSLVVATTTSLAQDATAVPTETATPKKCESDESPINKYELPENATRLYDSYTQTRYGCLWQFSRTSLIKLVPKSSDNPLANRYEFDQVGVSSLSVLSGELDIHLCLTNKECLAPSAICADANSGGQGCGKMTIYNAGSQPDHPVWTTVNTADKVRLVAGDEATFSEVVVIVELDPATTVTIFSAGSWTHGGGGGCPASCFHSP